MASDEKLVITAIRDMSQEGFIATSLKRSGWSVIYRATSNSGLSEKLLEYPAALLLLSDDFGFNHGLHQGRAITIRGRSHRVKEPSPLNPQSDFEVAEMIRTQEADLTVRYISATKAEVIAISSVGGHAGATSVAITIAEQIGQLGRTVLLVDGNRIYPKIASHFQLHNIRGGITSTEYGFSICEATDLQSLTMLAEQAEKFEQVILDLGPHSLARAGGQRVEDLLRSWAINSQAREIIVARDESRFRGEISQILGSEKSSSLEGEVALFLLPEKILGRRDRKRFIEERGEFFNNQVDILSRDQRSIAKMESAHSTLHLSAPQSLINGDIARYLQRERYS